MRYSVDDKGEKLIITGTLIDYGVVGLLTFNKGVCDRRCAMDDTIRGEWERRGKPVDLSWIAGFEKEEGMRLLVAHAED